MLATKFFLPKTTFLIGANVLIQATRNTFILKRRWPPGLHKKNQKPHSLRTKNYVYDLVENTDMRKRRDLSVILTQFVDGIGDRGECVKLKESIAYNKLLLPGLAVYDTPENRLKYEKITSDISDEEQHSSPFAQRTVNVLEKRVIAVCMNRNQPWVIEPWHIRVSLRKAGIYAPDDAIELPSDKITGPDLQKQNKEFICTVTVNGLEKAKVRCRIHHWSRDPFDRLPYVEDHWKESAEPLLIN